nr:omega-amidase, chloroplastic [Quercus suber]
MASSTPSSLEHTMLAASEQVPSNITKFKIGLCQLSVTSEKNQNLVCARNSIKAAVECGARLVVLPEMWNCPYSNDYFAKFAEDFENEDASPTFSMLSEAACSHGITIVGGSVPESSDGRLYNTSCVFGPDGKLKAKHRKIHLFDIEIPGDITFKESDFFAAGDKPTIVDTDVGRIGIGICHDIRFPELAALYRAKAACSHGITIVGGSVPESSDGRLYNTSCVFGPDGKLKAKHRKIHLFDIEIPGDITFKESDFFAAGDKPTIVDTDVGRIGIGICHDIRFPELAALYRAKGARIICYPGAFNISTGELLWEVMQRARAADNQLFVATCSPSRDSSGSYAIWGHSTLVGPSGEIIATSGHEETVVVAEIDYSKIELQSYAIWGHSTLVGPSGEIIATSGHEETVVVAEIDYSKIELQRKGLPLDKQKRADIYLS